MARHSCELEIEREGFYSERRELDATQDVVPRRCGVLDGREPSKPVLETGAR